MTDTIPAQSAGLAVIERAIAGVEHAFDQAPNALQPGDLPAFVNFPGASSIVWNMSDDAGAEGNETRTWFCRLYVAPRASGVDGEIIRQAQPFFDRGRDAFQGHPSLGSVLGVMTVRYLGDDGLNFGRMNYQGMMFSGIQFRVQVLARVRSNYAAGE